MEKPMTKNRKTNQSGFSLIELLVVVVLITILFGMSFLYLIPNKLLYKTEDEALKLVDVLQDAKQLALNQRQIMRVEVNASTNSIVFIDENLPTIDSDDVVIKSIPLPYRYEVKVGERPSNIGAEPTEPSPVPPPTFAPSSNPKTQGNSVAVLRFTSTGQVRNAGVNALGAGSVPTGMTIYVWKPNQQSPGKSDMTRGITVLGATGTVRLWSYAHDDEPEKWVKH
jgi:prepilin-type N-terminal cleavage/methylation domain-containing protein